MNTTSIPAATAAAAALLAASGYQNPEPCIGCGQLGERADMVALRAKRARKIAGHVHGGVCAEAAQKAADTWGGTLTVVTL